MQDWLFDDPVQVISLRRSRERRERFAQRHAGFNWAFEFVDGVDGAEQWPGLSGSRRVQQAWQDGWSQGAIGAGLSHCLMWRRCLQLKRPICVLEDDVIVASEWREQVANLLDQSPSDPDFLLLGWNLDSVLKAELFPGVCCISLFEPPFLGVDLIRRLLRESSARRFCRLQKALGLPGYVITPSGAQKLLDGLPQLIAEPLIVGRGIPEVPSMTLDAQMNRICPTMSSYVAMPPLVLAENDKVTSMTSPRHTPQDFGSTV